MGRCQEVGESPRLGILGKQPPPRSSARPQEPVTERGRGAHVCAQIRSRGSWHLSRLRSGFGGHCVFCDP